MDIYCVKCGEPIDNDEIHYVAEDDNVEYIEVLEAFQLEGCSALGFRCNKDKNVKRASAAAIAYELLGDDIDGMGVFMDDAEMLGLL